jgi:phosphate-selective porin OprO/OprP
MKKRKSNITLRLIASLVAVWQPIPLTSLAEETNNVDSSHAPLQGVDARTIDLIKQLQKRIEELEQKVRVLEQSKPLAEQTNNVKAAQHIEELDQKVKSLEADRKLEQEALEAKAKEAPKISIGANGFSFASANGDFGLRLGGVIQVDSRTFFDNPANAGASGLLLRRARPYIGGTVFRDFDFLFVPDFAPSSGPTIFDAFVNYRYNAALQLQAGKFKVPVGLEQLVQDRNVVFNERALATDLVPNRDIGFALHGDLLGKSISYSAGVFNGTVDGGNSPNTDFANDVAFAGRLFFLPFATSSATPLQKFGFGLSGSYESLSVSSAAGLPSNTGGSLPGYYTDGQQQFFAYNPADKAVVVAKGQHSRLSPQAYYYIGPFGLMAEYVISDQQVARTVVPPFSSAHLWNTGWEVTASWILTGEQAAYNEDVAPRRPFNPAKGHWGALQLVGRFMELNVDSAAFPMFSDPATSARSAAAWSVGLNWYLNRNILWKTSFSHTMFDGGGGPGISAPATVTRKNENVLFTRLQLAF